LTERDEFAFHEMMAHLPLCSHRNPRHVLIVGGGDGAVLREVCRHPEVQKVTLVEIDPVVIKVAREHLQLAPTSLFDDDPRVQIVHADAAEYLQDPAHQNQYDVILADTLDPLGPAESLFEPEFYEAMHVALRPDGIICTQGESMWIHFELIRDLVGCCAEIFDYAEYATTTVPSYPCGQIGFVLARKGQAKSCRVPVRVPTFQNELKWYNSEMHRAAFVLPQYVKEELEPINNQLNDNDKYGEGEDEQDGDGEGDCFLAGLCAIQ
jgi:spermidine synthase